MRAIGLYFCQGEDDTELTFTAGDVIERVKPSEEPGWFWGVLNNKQGLFPGNYTRFESDPIQDSKVQLSEESTKIADSLPAQRIQSIYRDKFAGTLYTSQENLASKPLPPKKPTDLQLSSNESISSRIQSFEQQARTSISSIGNAGNMSNQKVKPPVPNRPSSSVSTKFDVSKSAELLSKAKPPIPTRPPEQIDPFSDMFGTTSINYSNHSSSNARPIPIPPQQLQLYQELFEKHDRFKRNFLSATLIRSIWAKSQLDPMTLGLIWNMLHNTAEGLCQSEFCIGNNY